MTSRLLLCTDLDRTLIPNGREPESPGARRAFAALVARTEVHLVYVTGRDRELVLEAMAHYELPQPALVIADVGSTIYYVAGSDWRRDDAWSDHIAQDWRGRSRDELAELLAGVAGLRLQEAERQGAHKLSYLAPPADHSGELVAAVRRRLRSGGVRAAVVWSVDEARGAGLVDVLPQRATKLGALEYVMDQLGYGQDATLFAGDSGNDLDVLASHVRTILVANARDEVRREAIRLAAEAGQSQALYIARGGWQGMNGNYAAGILEGVAHYRPEIAACT